jgi:DNA-directed RNA polymerase sigma subunit (sigma70/sigma32)
MTIHEHGIDSKKIGADGSDFFNEIEVRRFHGQIARHGASEYLVDTNASEIETVYDEVIALLGLYATRRLRQKDVTATIEEMMTIIELGTPAAAIELEKTKVNLANRKIQVAKQIVSILNKLMSSEESSPEYSATSKPEGVVSHRSASPVEILKHSRPVSSDPLTMHYQETRHELLAANREVELAKAIEAGLFAEAVLASNTLRPVGATDEELRQIVAAGIEAKTIFIESNLRLVQSLVRKHYPTANRDDMADRIQMGYLGLIRAVEKFDYTKGFKFSTYAASWIRQFVDRERANTERHIRLPAGKEQQLRTVRKERDAWYRQYGEPISNEELSLKIGFDVAKLEKDTREALGTISLQTPLGDNFELIDILSSEH